MVSGEKISLSKISGSIDMEDARKLTSQMTYLEQQAESLKLNLDYLKSHLQELIVAKETMDNILKAEKGQEVLFPLGAGCFTSGHIDDVENVIIDIGSRVSVKQDVKKGISTMEKRIEEVRKIVSNTSAAYKNIREEMEMLESKAREIMQQSYQKTQ